MPNYVCINQAVVTDVRIEPQEEKEDGQGAQMITQHPGMNLWGLDRDAALAAFKIIKAQDPDADWHMYELYGDDRPVKDENGIYQLNDYVATELFLFDE